MKKFLAILGSIGLVATAASTVIACATEDVNKPNVNTSEINSWFVNAQPKKDENGQMQEGKTMVIAIGGRHNSDTLSYLATLNWVINNKEREIDANKLVKQENVKQVDTALSSYDSKHNDPSIPWHGAMRTILNAFFQPLVPPSNDDNTNSKIATDYFYYNQDKPITQVDFHTILVDKIENFWTGEIGKYLVNEIIGPQLEEFLKFTLNTNGYPPDPTIKDLAENQDKYNKFIKNKTKNILDNFKKQNDSGPWFLVVRSGKIIGIKTGFRNYYEFNPDYELADKADNSLRSKSEPANITFKQFAESIANSLVTGIEWLKLNYENVDKTISNDNYIRKNRPDNNNQAGPWNSRTSGESNIDDLSKPRGDKEDKDEPENPDDKPEDPNTPPDDPKQSLNRYKFNFLD